MPWLACILRGDLFQYPNPAAMGDAQQSSGGAPCNNNDPEANQSAKEDFMVDGLHVGEHRPYGHAQARFKARQPDLRATHTY